MQRLKAAACTVTRLHQLGKAIVSGVFLPGEKLPGEIEGSDALGISRTAYREATRMLTAKGMLVSRPKIGTLVCPRDGWNLLDPDILSWFFQSDPSEDFIRDLFELRMIVEPAAAGLAALKRTDEQLEEMTQSLNDMEKYTLATEEGRSADRNFHDIILAATNNEVLISLSSGIGAAVRWTTIYKQRETTLPRDPIPDHRRVLDAIAAKDSEGAKSACITLLLLAHEDTKLSM
ncbi:FadR/GntR family transcriptional regulator [Litorimonas sp. RW-G-Af-16]|uniref:FadR/GntR family transcriptional regulator n=1 Tax=Litorimonas sp. RW-G-Af-16 TaxID=3241168 RepID=UPI003AAFE974